jgi:hypothetical protein
MGRSLSVAAGTIPTNGVQPLVAFLWAGVHWMTRSQPLEALRGIVLIEFAVACATAVFVALLVRHTLSAHPWRNAGSIMAAALWFASPLALRHTTNGLETGPYACAVAGVLLIDLRWRTRSALRAIVVGAALGIVFLVRNDAVFLVAVFVGAELWVSSDRPLRVRCLHAVLLSAAALTIASPWLLYNARVFGSIVPVSGRAQSLNLSIGESFVAVPRTLAEYAWMLTPLPAALGERRGLALLTALALLPAVALTVTRWRRVGIAVERWMVMLLVDAALLTAYYGLLFGASYFLSRYLFPLALVSVLLPVSWMLPRPRGQTSSDGYDSWRETVVSVCAVLLVAAAAQRFYARAAVQDHLEVVNWVSDHVAAATWVGAPQSGTLGYFHDRTINLDGKVNPLALQARRDNRLFHYIVDDTQIEYLADWYGLARWVDRPDTVREERDVTLLADRFSVVVRDPQRNLVVLKRKPR